ncbi:hypothetical protein V5O48_004044 [Marasmius crinis-equi]|uniref:Uncharacterized protein n=1 Tax=Marasmius crinis-equi TaxID=585013 RepID=A0ABR3FRP7_9AGAR
MTSTNTVPGPRETSNPTSISTPFCRSSEFRDQYRNSLNRDPCQIAGELVTNPQCLSPNGTQATDTSETQVQALYSIVQAQEVDQAVPTKPNPCFCSSPVYALISFCRSCQGNATIPTIPSWQNWTINCNIGSDSTNSAPPSFLSFPFATLLDESHVPKWANDSQSIVNGTFSLDVVRARVEGGDHSEFGSPATNDTPDGDPPDGSSDPNSEGTQAGSSSKTPVGAIVGGVVGGVAFIALLGLIFWFIRRRKQGNKEAPSAAYIRSCGGQVPTPASPTPFSPYVYVRGSRQSFQYPNEKAILAERENNDSMMSMMSVEKPPRQDSNTTESEYDPYSISETPRLRHSYSGERSGEPASPLSVRSGDSRQIG